MKKHLLARRLILPLLAAFLILTPLLGVAAVGEHRYAVRHPAYARHLCSRILGEETAATDADDWSRMEEISAAEESSVHHILVLGRDSAAGLTDVMMLVSLDGDAGSVRVLQLPRDTYANYTKDRYKKLNGAYRKLGGVGLTEFVSHHMGISVDRYLCMDLSVFGEVVDALGGVPMNVPSDMDYDDPTQGLHIHLDAGQQTLNGKQAQMFVRYRSGYASADLGRMDAQKLFLSALARQAKAQLTVPRLTELACSCLGKMKTNLSLKECIACVKILMDADLASISMATLQGESVTPQKGGAWYYLLNREAAQAQLKEMFTDAGPFDPDRVFTDQSRQDYRSIYLAPASRYAAEKRTAKELLEGADAPAARS